MLLKVSLKLTFKNRDTFRFENVVTSVTASMLSCEGEAGLAVWNAVGDTVRASVGEIVGEKVGETVGALEGDALVERLRPAVGASVG